RQRHMFIRDNASACLDDEKAITIETLISMKRAGDQVILTYTALDVANWLKV
ncbi:porphobilinogen synthase, partial [Francisella tularensis]|nr:porphobilinogen synthase [Francisella tularensis]